MLWSRKEENNEAKEGLSYEGGGDIFTTTTTTTTTPTTTTTTTTITITSMMIQKKQTISIFKEIKVYTEMKRKKTIDGRK